MGKIKFSLEQKKTFVDILIITAISLCFLAVYFVFQKQIINIIKHNDISVLARTLLAACFQFGIAGLGLTAVSILRKETLSSHGLKKKGIVLSIILCILCFMPYIIFSLATHQANEYFPFKSVWTTKEVLKSNFPTNVIGMLIIGISWGFFEAFNYVVISDKINKCFPTKHKWLNWGAIFCSASCILIHGLVGINFSDIVETLCVIIIIYGMLLAKDYTGNAWGCVFIFIFLWNAF